MGSPISQVQQPQTSGGKGQSPQSFSQTPDSMANQADFQQPPMSTQDVRQGKGASGQRFTYSPTSGQPQMGRPNQYTNTVGGWDNASIQQPVQRSGKGKGG